MPFEDDIIGDPRDKTTKLNRLSEQIVTSFEDTADAADKLAKQFPYLQGQFSRQTMDWDRLGQSLDAALKPLNSFPAVMDETAKSLAAAGEKVKRMEVAGPPRPPVSAEDVAKALAEAVKGGSIPFASAVGGGTRTGPGQSGSAYELQAPSGDVLARHLADGERATKIDKDKIEATKNLNLVTMKQVWAGMEQARAATEAGAALLGLPTTLRGLASRGLHAGAPTAMSTLSKSFDLVAAQLTIGLIPAIAWVIKRLQDFSGDFENAGKNGKGPFDSAGSLGGHAAEGAGALWGLLGGEGFGARALRKQGLPADYIEKETKRNEAHKNANDAFGKQMDAIRGGEHGEALKGYLEGLKKEKKAIPEFDLLPPEMRKEAEKHKGLSEDWKHADSFMAGGKNDGRGGAGGKNGGQYLHDNPPGYQAQFSQFADVRRKMQLDALNKSPLDQRLQQLQMRAYELLVRHMEKNDGPREVPGPKAPAGGGVL